MQLASQDALTGLPNRRRTQELALAALELAKATRKPLTLALIDMDHFKDINDRCGHAAGDHVLQEFARAGREALRETDILGRWGGEEFLLLDARDAGRARGGEPRASAHAGVRHSTAAHGQRSAGLLERGTRHV